MPNPIYTLDIRKRTIKEAKHFPSPEIKDRSNFNMSVHPPTLILNPARVEDEAEYKCRVDLRRSRTLILHTKLRIIVLESLVRKISGWHPICLARVKHALYVHVTGTCCPKYSYDSFIKREIIYQGSMMGPVIIAHQKKIKFL
ncbi:uncharacterized protein TNIN_72411 [Trichonephila inaurata madagascariensis]|uniref:Uncharacterized protein n=1 Tax=Trichonephila inaurata madagascariensis TaxID=2747483 RepID=A0A8X6XUI1_9ARAC|nr:uncharacterized protein TNIN_72411 [Trichonephila inaurata madagascariensis]